MTLTETVAFNIKRARIRKAMTQSQVAEAVPCSISMVSMLERASREPSLTMLGQLAEVFKMKPYELLYPPTKGK